MRLTCLWMLPIGIAVGCDGGNGTTGLVPDAFTEADAPPADARPQLYTCDDADVPGSLMRVPGIVSVTPDACTELETAASCFMVEFRQPVRHEEPNPTNVFNQRLQLIHRGCDRAVVVADWGYELFPSFYESELSEDRAINAINVEHRYQGESIPTVWDWTALTIDQGANDQHALISALRGLYTKRWISTGASKGGVTALYHRFRYPNDLDGTVAYVAPASRARVDGAYQTFLDTTIPAACQSAIRAHQQAALTTRRKGLSTLLGGEAAVEQTFARLDWGFWQYVGVTACGSVPAPNATDQQLLDFLTSLYGGASVASGANPGSPYSDFALFYEWLTEQGFADQIGGTLRPLIRLGVLENEETFRLRLPEVALPAFDGTVTDAMRGWLRTTARRVLLIYGEFDPWTGGALDVGPGIGNGKFVVPGGTHLAMIEGLLAPDRAVADGHVTEALATPPTGNRRRGGTHDKLLKQLGAYERALLLRSATR